MKVIVAGSRAFRDCDHIEHILTNFSKQHVPITELIHGDADGVDACAEKWAELNNIPATPFPAAWDDHGKRAGPIRNDKMAKYAEALLAITMNGEIGVGTSDMLRKAKKHKINRYIADIKGPGKFTLHQLPHDGDF